MIAEKANAIGISRRLCVKYRKQLHTLLLEAKAIH